MTATIDPRALAKSRVAESIVVQEGSRRETSLARVVVPPHDARGWKITLSRAERKDGNAMLAANVDSPLFVSQSYAYLLGVQNNPTQDPPRRSNRVGVGGTGGGSVDCDPPFVELAWGTGEAAANRLIAHWPMTGATLTVFGSYVEVFAGTFLNYGGNSQEDLPRLAAQIVPLTGNERADASDELSATTDVSVSIGYASPGAPAVLYVPDFARRVRVFAVDPNTLRPFDFGQPRLNLEWFDDLPTGSVSPADVNQQGSSVGIAPEWNPVPARATMLRIGTPGPNLDCGESFTDVVALVHWRIAP